MFQYSSDLVSQPDPGEMIIGLKMHCGIIPGAVVDLARCSKLAIRAPVAGT